MQKEIIDKGNLDLWGERSGQGERGRRKRGERQHLDEEEEREEMATPSTLFPMKSKWANSYGCDGNHTRGARGIEGGEYKKEEEWQRQVVEPDSSSSSSSSSSVTSSSPQNHC